VTRSRRVAYWPRSRLPGARTTAGWTVRPSPGRRPHRAAFAQRSVARVGERREEVRNIGVENPLSAFLQLPPDALLSTTNRRVNCRSSGAGWWVDRPPPLSLSCHLIRCRQLMRYPLAMCSAAALATGRFRCRRAPRRAFPGRSLKWRTRTSRGGRSCC